MLVSSTPAGVATALGNRHAAEAQGEMCKERAVGEAGLVSSGRGQYGVMVGRCRFLQALLAHNVPLGLGP